MFLEEFKKYNSQYSKGIKKISYRSNCFKIVKEPIDFKLQKTNGNYDLYFNKKGVLIESVHLEEHEKFKAIYCYRENCKLACIIKLGTENNNLISTYEFVYNNKGKIEIQKPIVLGGINFYNSTKYIHSYKHNFEEQLFTNDDEDGEDCTFYFSYDNKNRIIEEKGIRYKDELISWNKNDYDDNDNLVKQTSLDEEGNPDGIYEYHTPKNGLITGYNFNSEDSNYVREYGFTFNDKGDWINQTVLHNGEPRYSYDRSIEYY